MPERGLKFFEKHSSSETSDFSLISLKIMDISGLYYENRNGHAISRDRLGRCYSSSIGLELRLTIFGKVTCGPVPDISRMPSDSRREHFWLQPPTRSHLSSNTEIGKRPNQMGPNGSQFDLKLALFVKTSKSKLNKRSSDSQPMPRTDAAGGLFWFFLILLFSNETVSQYTNKIFRKATDFIHSRNISAQVLLIFFSKRDRTPKLPVKSPAQEQQTSTQSSQEGTKLAGARRPPTRHFQCPENRKERRAKQAKRAAPGASARRARRPAPGAVPSVQLHPYYVVDTSTSLDGDRFRCRGCCPEPSPSAARRNHPDEKPLPRFFRPWQD